MSAIIVHDRFEIISQLLHGNKTEFSLIDDIGIIFAILSDSTQPLRRRLRIVRKLVRLFLAVRAQWMVRSLYLIKRGSYYTCPECGNDYMTRKDAENCGCHDWRYDEQAAFADSAAQAEFEAGEQARADAEQAEADAAAASAAAEADAEAYYYQGEDGP